MEAMSKANTQDISYPPERESIQNTNLKISLLTATQGSTQ